MTNIMDMGKNPNFLGSYDLYDLSAKEIVVTIKSFSEDGVVTNGKTEKCGVCHFVENCKPMIINPTNKKTLAKLFKTVDGERMIGKQITIGIKQVKAFGEIHDALRIKSELPKIVVNEVAIKCEDCTKNILSANGMTVGQVAAYTKSRYDKCLCTVCAHKRAAESKAKVQAEQSGIENIEETDINENEQN